MQAEAIREVTEAMRSAIAQALGVDEAQVFVGPLDDPGATDAEIVLFLHRVAVNAELRNTPHRVPAPDPASPATVFETSLPLDLHYLVTVGAKNEANELVGLDSLGQAIQAFNANPFLVGGASGREIVRLTIESAGSEELGRIWTLFPAANYRTSVTYLASPVWIDPRTEPPAGPPVISERLRFQAIPPMDDDA